MASDALIWCWLSNTPWTGQCSTNHRPLQRQLHVISRSLHVCLGMGPDEMMRLAQHHLGSHRWLLVDSTGPSRERRYAEASGLLGHDPDCRSRSREGQCVAQVRSQVCFAHRRIAKRPRAPASNNPTPRRLRSPTRGGAGCTTRPPPGANRTAATKKTRAHAHDPMTVAELACIEPHRGSDCHLSQAQAHPSLTRPSPGPLR